MPHCRLFASRFLVTGGTSPVRLLSHVFAVLALSSAPTVAGANEAALQLAAPETSYVRLRWPDTTLTPRAAGRVVALTDGNGTAVPFTFAIAPEDEGKTTRPLWLVFQPDRQPPYTLASSDAGEGAYVERWGDLVTGDRLELAELPLATSQPGQSWGPLIATVRDAEASQQAEISRWRAGAIALAVVSGTMLLAVIGVFARHQLRKNDVTKL